MRLWEGESRLFPEFIAIDGERIAISADFRNILRILAMLKDGHIADVKKMRKLRDWFMPGAADAAQAAQAFGEFARGAACEGGGGGSPSPPQFCYDFDGGAIYASFLSEYQIDLLECSHMHWYKFRLLLENLPETSAFGRRLALRFFDLSRFSREEPGFFELFEAWSAVQLPLETAGESEESREFEAFWERIQ